MRRPAWVFAVQIGRQPQIHVCRETKSGREHADNGVDRAINLQVRLREVLRRSEILPPVSIADKNGGASPFFRVAGAEIPPEDRLNTEDLEKVGRDACNRRARRLRSSRNGRDVVIVLRNRLEAAALIAKVVEVRVRKARRPALRGDLEDGHDPVRIGVRQRPQQHAVYNAENCRGRADAERQREDGDGGERGILTQHAEGKAQVLEQGFKEGKSTMIADGFFGLFEAAEFEEGVASGCAGGHAGAEVVRDVQFEVASQFVIQFAVELLFVEQAAQAGEEGANDVHGCGSGASDSWKRKPRRERGGAVALERKSPPLQTKGGAPSSSWE